MSVDQRLRSVSVSSPHSLSAISSGKVGVQSKSAACVGRPGSSGRCHSRSKRFFSSCAGVVRRLIVGPRSSMRHLSEGYLSLTHPAAQAGSIQYSASGLSTSSRLEPQLSALRQRATVDALTPNTIFRFEVQIPPIVHDVPLKAIERSLRTPSVSPKKEMAKRAVRPPVQMSKSSSKAE